MGRRRRAISSRLLIRLGALCVAIGLACLAIGALAPMATSTRVRLVAAALFALGVAAVPAAILARRNLRQLQSSVASVGASARAAAATTAAVTRPVETPFEAEVRADVKALRARLDRLDRNSTQRRDALYRQTESLIGLYVELYSDAHSLPHFRKWAIAPDLALHLAQLVRRTAPDLVVETGSGSSTVVLARALERNGRGHVVALEHNEQFARATQQMLVDHGLAHRATVQHCPLVDVEVDGEVMSWYDVSALSLPRMIDLMLVDGPPAATGPQARRPVLSALGPWLRAGTTVVLDDMSRADEVAIVDGWVARGLVTDVERLPFEKGVAQMVVSDVHAGTPPPDR